MNNSHLQKIQKVMDDAVAAKSVAGLNLLICKDNNETAYFESGFRDIKNKKSFTRDTICRLYSMSKPVTGVAAMILLQDGKLDLGEEVSKYLPEYKNLTVCETSAKDAKPRKVSRPLLIQDLLNMTSGYGYGANLPESTPGEKLTTALIEELNKDCLGPCKITTREVAKRLASIPVNFEPGTDYNYGLSADIMGAVIEVISGMKFSDFLKKKIFEPLGMNDTDFYVPEDKQNRLSCVYKDTGNGLELFENPNLGIQPFMDHAPSFESGGAGLCSSIDDYMKFTQMLCNRGEFDGKRILLSSTVEYLSSARLIPSLQKKFDERMPHLPGYTYCNYMRVAIDKGASRTITENGEFGWDGWLGPYMSVDLKNHLSIVMLMQRTDSGTWELTRKIKNIVYTSL
jgi:CubicO group peptidase (beta-lactamase class C family)